MNEWCAVPNDARAQRCVYEPDVTGVVYESHHSGFWWCLDRSGGCIAEARAVPTRDAAQTACDAAYSAWKQVRSV